MVAEVLPSKDLGELRRAENETRKHKTNESVSKYHEGSKKEKKA